ncbi:hypothetical protein QQF64_028060 [Cirrhinus molitorella]|uniref:Uncharacterized protein n=1 Tax=Cirrhinus molitorella TaxID=172907 RepID=A0ABR3N5U5_9TELE
MEQNSAQTEESQDEGQSDSSESMSTNLDADYKPSISASSSSSDADCESPVSDSSDSEDTQRGKCSTKRKKKLQTYVKRHNKKHKTNRDKLIVTLKVCTKREDKKRVWDKRHYCLYCGKSQLKISRHLERKHMEVKDVAYAFSFPLGSKERKILLEQLRNKGDFKHNTKVLDKGRGQIVTWKQPSDKASIKDYLPCPYCFGMFKKHDLWRHQSSCKTKKSCVTDEQKKTGRVRVQSRAASLLPISASSGGCQSIINNMRQDDVSFHIRSDSLICKYGESLYAKHGRIKSRHQYISQRMRELGRFMLAAKDMDKTVNYLEDLCVPSKFQLVVKVAKHLTQFSPNKNEYGKPSTAVKIGFCLKGAVEVLIGQTLMNEDDLGERKAKKFFELLEKNWRNSVSVTAHQTIQEKKWNKQDDIPLTKNVIALRDHLRMVEDKAREQLTQQLDLHAYKTLNETILAQVIIFNKRREGEASRLTLDIYQKASTGAINEDIYETLSPLEKELSKLLTRIEIRGKRGKKVPVFLTKRMKESIDLLIQRREEAGVLAENPYLFARPGVMTNIRGCDCLRKYAQESKAENPELLRSTKLRKQVATLCQLLDLNEQELEQVARFMGHDIRVHHDFYRQTDKTFQIAKISKLLFAMEQGTDSIRGKNLSTLAPSVCVESPTASVQQRQHKKHRRESDEDERSNLLNPPKKHCSDNMTSDIADDCPGVKRSTPKKKRAKQTKKGKAKEGRSDLLSPEKMLESCDNEMSDIDDDCPGVKRSTPKKKRAKQTKKGKAKEGRSDLLSPEKMLESCDKEMSDIDDDCPGVKRSTPKKKRAKQTKKGKAKEGRSDLLSPEKMLESCDKEMSDIDDDCPGVKRSTPKKKRAKQTMKGKAKEGRSDLFSPEKMLESCHIESSDIDDDCPGVKRSTPKKKRAKQTMKGKAKEATNINVKRPWSQEERNAVDKHMGRFMAERRVPGKDDCMQCIEKEKALGQSLEAGRSLWVYRERVNCTNCYSKIRGQWYI